VGDGHHVFGGQKLLHSQRGVCGCIVMEHTVVYTPFVWSLPLHVLSKSPLDIAVELSIDGLTWRDRFLMDNPVDVEKADQHGLCIAFHLLHFLRPE